MQATATQLAAQGGLASAACAAELARLLSLPGVSLLLQVSSTNPDARLTVSQRPGNRALLGSTGAGSCGSGYPADAPAGDSHVLILWMRNDAGDTFDAVCPPHVRRMAIVANGRLLQPAISLGSDGSPVIIDLGRS
jgi:hypothetical protein